MRITALIFIGPVAALAVLAAPTLAKNSTAQQKSEDRPTSSSCHAYQQATDGSWTELPCEETGTAGQTQHKPPPKSSEHEPR
jgi:hypothetical protein